MKTKIFVLEFLCLFFWLAASAQRVASVTGNWGSTATWGGAAVPSASDPVIINSGITVTVNENAAALSIINNGTLNVGAFSLTISNETTITGTGTLNITSATGAKTFNGDVTINSGGKWNNTVATVPLTFPGNFTNDGTFNSGAGVYTFSGAGKSIGGSVATTFANLSITGSVTNNFSLTNGGLTISTSLSGSGTLTNATNSLLVINGATSLTGLVANANPNTITYNNTAGPSQNIPLTTYHHLKLAGAGAMGINDAITINGDMTINGPKVTWNGNGSLIINGDLLINSEFIVDRSGLTVAGVTTIAGTLNIKQAFFSTINDMVVSPGGDVKINTQQTTLTITGNINGSWNGGVKANTFNLTGIGKTIIGTIDFGPLSTTNITGSYTNNGSLTFNTLNINSGGSMINNGSATVMGNLESPVGTGAFTQGSGSLLNLNGTSSVTVIDASASNNTVTYIGTTQTIRSTTYHHLVLDASGTKTAGGSLTVNGDFIMNNGSASVFAYGTYVHDFYGNWIINSSSTSPINATAGSTINFKGTNPVTIGGSTGATLPFTQANFSNTGGVIANANMSITTGIMTVLSDAILTLPATTVISGTGTFDLNAGGNLEIGSTDGIAATGATGNVQTVNRVFNTAANYTYNGPSSQMTGTGLGSGIPATPPLLKTVNKLSINNISGITLSNDINVAGSLEFMNGKVTTNANKVIIESSASISGTGPGKYINGNLRRNIPAIPDLVIPFDIGDAINYSPATINFTGTPSGGSIDAFVTTPAPPASGSGILSTKYINRSWTLLNNSVGGFTSYSPTFTFASTDLIGGVNTANVIIAKNSNGTWSKPTIGTRGSTSTQATGLTSFSEFVIGEPADATHYVVNSSNSNPEAGSMVTITAQLTDVNGNAIQIPGVIVTWSKSDANGSFASVTSITDANGVATVVFTSHTVASTATTITATDANNLTGTSGVITTIPGAAAKYIVSASNYSPAAGSAITISAQLADANNNPVATAGVVLTWSKADINGTFASATSTTDANGLASVMFTTHTVAATATTVTVTDAGSLTGTTPTITTISGAAAKYIVSASNYSPAAGSAVTITAQLADENNNPVSCADMIVNWSKSDISGSFATTNSTTDANGLATVVFTTHTAAAITTSITATCTGNLTGTSPAITTISGAPSKYIMSASNYSPAAGSAITITAQLADANDNPVATVGVVLTWSKSDINGTFASATSTTDANGLASVMFTTHTVAGTATTVTATDASNLTGTSGVITTIPGAAAKYLVSTSNYSPAAGSAITISAQLADANNNPVTTAGVVLTWSKSDLNGAFASATSTTDANGLASVMFTTHTVTATATTITATDAGSLTGTTLSITTVSGAASKYLVSASNYSPAAGSAITISAQLADANNNPVTTAGVVLTWSKSDLNGAFASATSTTDANGLASVMFTTHTVAGTATTVTATDASNLTGTSGVITTIPGAAAKYLVSASNYSPAAGSAVTISAQLADANNNPVATAGVAITWSKSDINGTFASATSTTDANGLASVMFTTHTVAATATTVTATDAGSLTGTTPTITTIPGAAAKYIVSASNYSPATGSAITITAQLADANDNPVTTAGVVLTWSKSDLNGAFASATSTTDANGLASVMFTTHTVTATATTITATDAGSLTGTTLSITTVSGAASKYLVSASNYSPAAGSAVTISAQLADANNNPVATAGVAITWSKSDINGTFASATSTTDANGLASVMFTTHTVAGTATTVTATDAGNLTGTSRVITTVSGAAAKYIVSASNYSPAAGSAITISAQLADANDNPVATAGVVLTWSKSDLSGTFASATSATDANGLASVMFTTHTVAGAATTVTATDAGSLTGTTPSITTVSGAAAKYIVSASNYSPAAGSAITITAQLADANNNPVTTAGVAITWSKSDLNGAFASATSTTDANGLATVIFTTHTVATTATTVTATDAGNLTGTSGVITTIPGAAAKYLVSASNYSPAAGSAITITAQLSDANNNPVATAGVVLTWSKSDIHGTFASATSTTDANGLASVMFTTHTVAGAATTVTATDASNLTGTSGVITTIPGAAAKYLVSASNYSPAAGSAVTITAQLADANNNPVATAGVAITWSKSDINGTFTSATSTTDANGLASVVFTSHTVAGAATTVTATDAGNLTGTSGVITTIPGAAAKYLVSASNYSPAAGSAITITAQLSDANNNPVATAGVVLTWSKSDIHGTFASATSTTDANGLASVMFTTHTVAATATTVTATDAGSLTGTTPTITTISGAAAKYIVIASNYSPAAGSAVTITAQLADANNNPVATAGVIITWSKSDINGTFASATSTTDANGLASVMFTTHTVTATATTITATDAGSLTGTTPSITTVSGAASKYLVSASNYSPAAGSAVTITAQLADANNNPVATAGVAITWSKSDINGTFASATSTTDANGLASVMFTTHTVAGAATTVTATCTDNLTGTSPTITTISGAPSKYIVSASEYSPAAGSAVTITAQLADVNNNPVATAGVVLTWSKSDINGTFVSATSTTDANGLASVMFTTHTMAGAATTVTATDASNLTGTSGVITTIPGAAAKYLVSASNYSPAAGSAVTITAQLADANNNPVATAGVVFTWSKSDLNGAFASATSTTDANGLASVMFTTHTVAATATTVTATDAGSLTGTTPAITTVSGIAVKLVITGSGNQIAGGSQDLSISALDANNNKVLTYSGDKNLIFGGAGSSGNPIISPTIKDKTGAVIPFGSSTVITFVEGSATAASGKNGVMTLYKAELATIAVTDQNISATGADRLNVNVTAAGFNKLVVSLTPTQTSSIPFTGTNSLIAQDVYGNTVSTFKSSENNILVTTSLEGVIFGLSGTNILNNHSDFNAGVANLTTLGLTFSGLPATGTFTFTPSNGIAATSGDVTIHAGNRQATPTFSPVAGAIAFGTTVTISSPGADAIYYTTDGSNPTTSSTNQAFTPLIINSAVSVKALAVKSGSDNSDIGIASYTQAISADLISLVLSGNPSNYTFIGNNYIYTDVKTTYDVGSIIITPTGIGTITVNGVIITSGNSSAPINLTPGIDQIITVTVTEIGKSPKTYTIHVKRALSSAKSITAFDFTSPAIQGVVNEASKVITVNVSFGTSLTGLVPIINHTGASVSPTSGEAHNFIADVPAIYTVTAADASTQNYSVLITYNNEPPTDIVLSAITLYENQESGTLAGTLNSLSNNINNSFNYSFISGSGDTDNDKFTITNKEIRTSQLFDYEKQKNYSVRIRSTTQQGNSFDKSFIILISDINEAPSIDELANQSICYTTNQQVIALSGISAGPETGQSTTISVSSNNPGLFQSLTSNGNQISYTIAPDQSGTATLTVRVKDNGGTNNGGVDEIIRTCTITVNPLNQVDIISNKGTTIARGEIAQLTASGGNTYQWLNSSGIITGQNSASLQVRPMQTTSYTVLVTNATGCTSTQTAIIEVKEDFTKILPANNFSPNGDQINDTWKVENIDAYPDHNLIIFDRGGRTVYTVRNYKNDWDGSVNGSRLDEGTYYYLFQFNKPGITPIKGFISIVY